MPDGTGQDTDVGAPVQQRRRRVVLVAGAVLLVVAAGVVLRRDVDDQPIAGLTVGWGGGEGDPACVYHPEEHTVDAKVTIEGTAPHRQQVTVTVTAYADENTSVPVGSRSRSVQVDGSVDLPLVLTIPVERAPFVGEDDVTACRLSVKY